MQDLTIYQQATECIVSISALDCVSELQKVDLIGIPQRQASIQSADTIGNTPATGKKIYLTGNDQFINEFIGGTDFYDYYQFQLSKQDSVSLRLGNLSKSASITLYASNGTIMGSDISTGTSDKEITRELAADTYYLMVKSSSNIETAYKLSAKTVALNSAWSTLSGYGLINTAAAVAKATNSSPFTEVTDLGGTKWFADMVKAPEVWAKGYTGKGVTVAVVDTGIDLNHSAFSGNVWTNSREIAGNGIDDDGNGFTDDVNGWDFVENDKTPQDANSHGTHVAGITDQIAPDVKLMAVRVLDAYGNGSYTNIAKGIRYAADNGANVINLSLGGTSGDSTLLSAIAYAYGKGVEVCMAAGNSGGAQPLYPAAYATQYGLAVGAVDSKRNLASFSNRSGTTVMDFVDAPGVNIYSTLPNNAWGYKSGTSMATPVVAGAVALLRSANPSLTPVQFEALLTGTASQLSGTIPTSTLSSSSTTTASIKALDEGLPHLIPTPAPLPMPLLLHEHPGNSTYGVFPNQIAAQKSLFQPSTEQFERFNHDRDESAVLDPLTRQLKERSQPRRNRLA